METLIFSGQCAVHALASGSGDERGAELPEGRHSSESLRTQETPSGRYANSVIRLDWWLHVECFVTTDMERFTPSISARYTRTL